MRRLFGTTVFMLLSACGLARCAPDPIDDARLQELYGTALAAPEEPVAVYFIGHSLIGREMPAMLAQLAGAGHRYETQQGWGAELQAHWEPDIELNGHEVENNHDRFREAHEAVASGDYDVLVMTEKVSLEASIKYHESWKYLSLWTEKAATANPETRIYLYETWHSRRDGEAKWLARLDQDLPNLWEREIIDRALADDRVDRPIYVIPGGQVMAAFARALEARGGVGNVASIEDLFRDDIHFNSLGAYLMALTHYAVIYGRSPVGLPHGLTNAEGQDVPTPDAEAARLMQEIVWDVVTRYPRTGIRASGTQ